MNDESAQKPLFRPQATAWALVSIVAATVWLYWPALGFDFVNQDDPGSVINNELVQSWSPQNFRRIATETVAGKYVPLTVVSFLLDHTAWGLQPTGYHLTNILLHILNSVLAYVLLMQLTRSRFVAWSTAILFAVHPIQVEAVVWVSSRSSLLSASFILASLMFWFRAERSRREEVISIGCLGAALLSGGVAVVLPPMMLMYDVLIRRKLFRESILRQIVPGVFALTTLAVKMLSQSELQNDAALSGIQLLAADSTMLWRYVGMLLYPNNLSVIYDPPTTGIAMAVFAASAGLLCVGLGGWTARKKYPLLTLAVASFFLLFVPALSVFSSTTVMNDRHVYLPSIVFFGLAVSSLAFLLEPLKSAIGRVGMSSMQLTATVAATIALMIGTQAYLPTWRNSETLWTHAIEQTPQLMVARVQKAHALREQGRDTDAMRVLDKALADCSRDSIDRPRIESLLEDWLRQTAQDDVSRRAASGRMMLRLQ